MIRASVKVLLKDDVMDPQGEAVAHALAALGHDGVRRVRVGRCFELALDMDDREAAEGQVRQMCEALLANTVIERYEIELAAK